MFKNLLKILKDKDKIKKNIIPYYKRAGYC